MANPTGLVTTNVATRTVRIDTNLSGKEYLFVTMDTTDDMVVNLAAAATAVSFILLEGKDGSTGGEKDGLIAMNGQTKLKITATVNAGQPLMPTTDGTGIVATDGKYYGAIALENGVSGDTILVQVAQGVYKTVS